MTATTPTSRISREAMTQVADGSVGSRSLLRRMNSLGILRALMSGSQPMRSLVAHSGLSRTAVVATVTDLVELGWLTTASGVSTGGLGRPATVFGLRENLGSLLSIDIGANHIFAVVTDLTGRLCGHRSSTVGESLSGGDRIARALQVGDELLAELSITRSDLWAVAVGSPGAIGSNGEVLFFGGTGMPGWVGLNLREQFSREYNTAVIVEGDVALGAQAELAIGAAQSYSDAVYILCGIRTSGASIIDGKVHRGVHGAAGIVGEMPELKWTELNERYGSSVLSIPRPSREEIFEAARGGDSAAVAAVREFAEDLATGAAAMALAIDPEVLIIGGGSAPGADVFLEHFEATLGSICPLPPRVIVSTLGSEAVAMGGISLAIGQLDAVLQTAVRQQESFPSPKDTARLLSAGRR